MGPDERRVVDALLTTTRSVRRRLDLERPVEPERIEECIAIALQAPTGSNRQDWAFVVVTDPALRSGIARYYRRAFEAYAAARRTAWPPGDPRAREFPRIVRSATYLAEHLQDVPVHVIPCIEGRAEHGPPVAQASLYGSILPAAWSFMLAARARGLGTAWTTLHITYEREVASLLGIPASVTQACLLPVAYFRGEGFRPAARLPARERTFWNRWGRTERS